MSTNLKATKLINKLENQQKEFIQINNSFVIFPYLSSGYIDFTNQGSETSQVNVNDYETFKRVWTGNDACVLGWKGSVSFVQEADKSITTRYQLGETLLGLLLDNNGTNELVKDSSYSEYTSQQQRKNLSFRIPAQFFELNDNWTFYFYKIPELSGSTLYRISTLTPEYVGRKLVAYLIDLVTINQDLANTGKAKQQNIMSNSPGQGYLEGVVLDSMNIEGLVEGKDYYKLPDGRFITSNWRKMINDPVRKVVVKAYGPAVFSNISFMGREVSPLSTFTNFGKPTIIFPMNLETATTPTIYRSQSSEMNYYWLQDASVTLQYWKELFEVIKGAMNPVNEFKYQGFLTYNYLNTIATNPKVNGAYTYSLFGYLGKVETTYQSFPWTINTKPSKKATNMIPGCEEFYNAYGSGKFIWDLMFDAYWVQKKYNVLPMNAQSHIGFGWTLGSSLGAIVTGKYWAAAGLLATGIIGSLVNELAGPFYEGFSGIVSAPLIDLCSEQFGKSASPGDKIGFNVFDGASNDTPSSAFFDGKTMNLSFQAELTNRFFSSRVARELKTENIGQTTFEDGTNILASGKPFLLNGDAKLTSMETQNGFIIDSFNIQAIFDGEYSIEFLNADDEVIWSGVYLSEGKWTGSSREINTFKNTSLIGRENSFFQEPLPYPKPLPDLISDLNKSYDIRKYYNNGWVASTYGSPVFASLLSMLTGEGYRFTYGNIGEVRNVRFEKSFETTLLEREFNSLDEFWNLYESMNISMINLKSFNGNGNYKEWENFNIIMTKNGPNTLKVDNFQSYSNICYKPLFVPFWTGFGYWFNSLTGGGGNENSTLDIICSLKLVNKKIVLVITTLMISYPIRFDTSMIGLENALAVAKQFAWNNYMYWYQEFKLDTIWFGAKK